MVLIFKKQNYLFAIQRVAFQEEKKRKTSLGKGKTSPEKEKKGKISLEKEKKGKTSLEKEKKGKTSLEKEKKGKPSPAKKQKKNVRKL